MRISRLVILFAIGVVASARVYGQGEANHWIFGTNVALNFSSGSPVVTPPSPALSTTEGSSVISDGAGNLLFYTDGSTVWNNVHQPIANGTGLMGNSSSTQSALIVPWPCSDCRKYLIFTTDAIENNLANGLRVSVVERSGTSWQVSSTQKNLLLQASSTEKLTAVSDGAGGFWVLAHGFNQNTSTAGSTDFYAYRVTCDLNVNNWTPVITKTGTALKRNTSAASNGQRAAQGAMKISHDGKRLAITGAETTGPFVEVFDFNTTTGAVSATSYKYALPSTQSTAAAYGLEFSPDSQRLFLSTTSSVSQPNLILRFDLATNLPSTMAPTQMATVSPGFAGTYFYDYGALQLAPDGKIYVARWNSTQLGVISSPNTGGSFAANGFSLGAQSSRLGLPAIVQGKFSCTPPPPGCCDRMDVTSHDQDNLTLKYRTFKIYNLKSPASDICWVEIVVTDANGNPPPSGSWQGGDVFINGVAIAAGTQFAWPYKRLPKAGDLTPRGAVPTPNTMQAALQFNIGIDFSLIYTANVKLVVHHCDGSTCTLTYNQWVVRGGGLPN